MIGKTILDELRITEKLDGNIHIKNIEPIPIYIDRTDWLDFKKELAHIEKDPVQLDLFLKTHGLEQIEGLRDYILSNDNIKKDSVNELIQTQNYTNIADQAHGFTGVNTAIKKYNELTDEASKNKFAETISKSNSSLGKYLSGLTDANGGILKYGISLVGATVKTFALELATTAMNAAISMGTSLIVSGIVSAITSWINHAEIMAQKAEKAKEKIQSLNQNFKENQTFVSDNAKRYAELAQGVDQLTGKNISLNSSDYQDFLDLSNQLAEMFPTLSRTYDENGNAIVQLSGNVDTIVGSLHNLIDAQRELTNNQIAEELPTIFKDVSAKSDKYTKDINKLKKERDDILFSLDELNPDNVRQKFAAGLEAKSFSFSGTNVDVIERELQYYRQILDDSGITYEIQNTNPVNDVDADGNQVFKYNSNIRIQYVPEDIDIEAIDFKTLNANSLFSNTEIENYRKRIEDLNGQINQITENNKANWSSFTNSMFAWLATDDTFKTMDDAMQSTMQNIINNLNWSELDFKSFDDATDYISEHILSFFQNGDNEELYAKFQVALDAQMQLNNGEITIEDYKKKIDNFLPLLNDVPDETKKAILFSLGLQMDDKENISYDVDTLLNNVNEKLQDKFDGKAKELTLDQLKIASEIEVPEGEQFSWDELLEKIKEAQNTLNEPLSLDDFKTASETLSSVSNAFKEMSDNGYLSLSSLSSIKTAVGSSIPDWDAFQQKLMNAKVGSAEFNQAMGQLTYAVLENQLGLKGLASADEQYIAAILKENGLLNANAIAHEMVQQAQARQEIQSKLTVGVTEENVAALINNATSCGIAQNAYLELLANEIAFGNNTLNVEDKINRLNQIALAANIAGLEIQSLNSDLTGTQKKERAAQLGISVNDSTEKKTKDKNGQEVDDWEYTYNGKTYTKFSDAEMAAESDRFIKRLNNSYADIDPSKYDFTKNTSTQNEKEDSTSAQNKEATKETFNWVETALSRVQRTIQTLSKAVSATWQNWTKRNSALASQLAETRREIALQQSAYEEYMAKAESVGLPDFYKHMVQGGSLSIEDITDETLKEQIHDYQDWYEKALSCRDAIDDLTDSVSSLYKTDFDNTASQFDSFLSVIEHRRSMLDAAISQTEEKGLLVSAEYYKALIRTEEENLAQLAQKKNALLLSLNNAVANGAIEEYSQDWYDMCGQIDDVTLAIEDANTAMIQYGNSIREINWEVFDLLQERISGITSESDFLLKLFENDALYDKDTGKITEEGSAVMGLHGMNYDVYLAQSEKYAQELLDINKQLANDPYNQTLIERKEKLIELQRESILAAEDEKKAIRDMVEEGINAELDSLKELIDTYTDALDSQKELFDYQKKVSKQTEEIASLQKQLSAYEGDDSEEAKATKQQLKVNMEDAQEELEETEYEKYIADQKQLLDELYLEYELILNQRLDNLDLLLTGVIDGINVNAAEISTTLSEKADSVGISLSESMRSIWETNTGTITQVLAAYGDSVPASANNVNTTLFLGLRYQLYRFGFLALLGGFVS